jgi:ribosome biogenesis GTPase / thiamine phosphate phosphatase
MYGRYMVRMTGVIREGSNNFFTVECTECSGEHNSFKYCSLKGKVLKSDRKYYNPLAPGDQVEIECDAIDPAKGQIVRLLPRKNSFVRWNVKGRCPQLMAANLDYLLLFTTPEEPPFRPRFIDRELAQAEYQNIEPVIICNKCDLPEAADEQFIKRISIWEKLGYRVFRISSKTGEGIETLSQLMNGTVCALVGQSGVGKSSLINKLDTSCTLRTGELSQKYGRGTHTTTKGALIKITLNLGSAAVIDTPGVRRFVLHDISAEDLALYFREMQPLLGSCEFGMSCSHLIESGCSIRAAISSGIISEERYESWMRIREEIQTGSWED